MVLGVGADASIREIKRAFRKKVRECHPDVSTTDEEAEERVKEVVKAYRALTSGQALSRSEWIAAAFRASAEAANAPHEPAALPVFVLKPVYILLITAAIAVMAVLAFPLLNAILFADPIFDFDLPVSLDGEQVVLLSLFLSANLVGAGTAAAAGAPVKLRPWLKWAVIGGVGFAALVLVCGLLSGGSIYGTGATSPSVPLALLAGAVGGCVGGAVCRYLYMENLYIHAASGATPAVSRAASAGAACLNVLIFLALAGIAVGVVMVLLGLYLANPVQMPSDSQ